jgi:hypothetical protein
LQEPKDYKIAERGALHRLIPLVYDELGVIASPLASQEWRNRSIHTTALVNEVRPSTAR